MGYDCTLHVIDEAMIRNRFIPRLLGKSDLPAVFDQRDDSEELWKTVRSALEGKVVDGEVVDISSVPNYITMLAIAYCAAELPYHYERGFCLSLWPDQSDEFTARVPKKYIDNPESLFVELLENYPVLKGEFPIEIGENYCTGIYVTAEKVPGVLKWAERKVKSFRKPDRRLFRGLLLVLKYAAEQGFGYWEGTEIPVEIKTIMPSKDQRREDLEEIASPGKIHMEFQHGSGSSMVFSHGIGFPQDCRTVLADFSVWPPDFKFWNEYARCSHRSRNGTWITSSMTSDKPYLYRVRIGNGPTKEKRVLIPRCEPKLGVYWVGVLGDRIVAYANTKEGSPKTLLIEKKNRLVPFKALPPVKREFFCHEIVQFENGPDLLVWNGVGYQCVENNVDEVFRFEEDDGTQYMESCIPFGRDRIFFTYKRRLHSIRFHKDSLQHLSGATNIIQLSPGPDNSIIVYEWVNSKGDLGKLYFPEDDTYVRLKSEIFEDEDPEDIQTLHWIEDTGRLIATTADRLWAVPVNSVLSLARYSGDTGKRIK